MTPCVMPDGAFEAGCDAVTSELRQAWSALDRAAKKVATGIQIWNDGECRLHGSTADQLQAEITGIRRSVERLELQARQMGTPPRPSPV